MDWGSHQEGSAVAGELGGAEPAQEAFLERGGDDGEDADGARGKDVGDGEPEAVVALEVPELVREHDLQLLGRQELQKGRVHDDEGLAARDG